MRPKVFIASAKESIDIAYAIQENLDYDAECTVWNQGIFEPTKGNLENLEQTLEKFDFGIFVFTPDDLLKIRKDIISVVRDNILFELGLFIGKLKRERSFIVIPDTKNSYHIPSDLLGITTLEYNPNRDDKNITAALGSACNKIRKSIRELGQSINSSSNPRGDSFSPVNMEGGLKTVLEKIEESINSSNSRMFSNFIHLDELTTGFNKGSLNVFSGVQSAGTSSFLINLVKNITENLDVGVCIFSQDLTPEQIILKMLSSTTLIPLKSLTLGKITGHQGIMISKSISKLRKRLINIYYKPILTLEAIMQEIQNLKNKQDVSVIVIDNIEKINSTTSHPTKIDHFRYVLDSLHVFAKQLDIVLFCGFQLDSNSVHERYKYPIIDKNNTPLIEESDLLLLLFRPIMYGITITQHGESTENCTEIDIIKNKFGKIGKFELRFDPDTTTFHDFTKQE